MYRSLIFQIILISFGIGTGLYAKPKPNKIRITEIPIQSFHSVNAQKALWRYLLSSPQWEVREERGKKFAQLKSIDTASNYRADGFILNDKSEPIVKLSIHFSGPTFDKNFKEYTIVANKNGASTIQLSTSKLSRLRFQSYSVVGDSVLSISIFEASNSPARKLTEKLFQEINKTLREVIQHSTLLNETGYLKVPEVQDSIAIKEIRPGYFNIIGNYPFTEEGEIYVRIVSARGNSLSGKMNRYNSIRPVAWSRDSISFSFMTFATNAEIPPGKITNAHFEIIFINTSGKENLILKSAMHEITSFDRSEGIERK